MIIKKGYGLIVAVSLLCLKIRMGFLYWGKSAFIYFFPSAFKQFRAMRYKQDPNYIHERDKHPIRIKHHGKGGWNEHAKEGLRYRQYESYDEYLIHQQQKLEEMLKAKGGFTKQVLLSYRYRFYRRFCILPKYIPRSAHILCAGARQGTEVEVLRDLGYQNACGIDLNPGPSNPFVQRGDFMKLENADSSLDMIYSNCIDHAFDLDAFFKEQPER